jgi:pyrroloquinoline-quinone synthase
MSLIEMRAAAARYDLLKHSFYTRWTAGELSLGELRSYATEYHHVVMAMPRWLEQMAVRTPAEGPGLMAHAREEAAHVPMWDDFAVALGCDRGSVERSVPGEAATKLLATGDELVASGRGAEALWALESQAPAVSAAKLQGLRAHYGMSGGPGTRYFELHTTLDVRHTRELEVLVAGDHGSGDAAEAVLERLHGLLSSVEREVAPA